MSLYDNQKLSNPSLVPRNTAAHEFRANSNMSRVKPTNRLRFTVASVGRRTEVNAALPDPFILGTLTLAGLIAKHDAIEAKTRLISKKEATLTLLRQQRETLYGDVSEDQREETSLITILETYHIAIELTFPGQPIVTTLPRIFPEQDPPPHKFKYNWRDLGGGQLKTCFSTPASPRPPPATSKKAPSNKPNHSSPPPKTPSPLRPGPTSTWSANSTSSSDAAGIKTPYSVGVEISYVGERT